MEKYEEMNAKCFNNNKENKLDLRKSVYHYTSPEGLLGIINSKSIRFTDCQFMNDRSEYTHIIDLLDKVYNNLKQEKKYDVDFVDRLLNLLKKDYEYEEVKVDEISDKLKFKLTQNRYYIFCTSLAKDSLNMWNYYVKNGSFQGYRMEMTIENLLDCFLSLGKDVEIFYGKIIYNNNSKEKLIKKSIIDTALKIQNISDSFDYQDNDLAQQDIFGDLLYYLQNFRLFFKDNAFKNEKEFRFIIKLPLNHDLGKKQIRNGFSIKEGIFCPYCEVDINPENTIDSIMTAPMLDRPLSKLALKRLLKENNYNENITLTQSNIPIRY